METGLWSRDETSDILHFTPEETVRLSYTIDTLTQAEAQQRTGHITSARRRRGRPIASTRPYRGRYVRPLPASNQRTDIDWIATLRTAATRRSPMKLQKELAVTLRPDDLLVKHRVHPPGQLLILVTDISGSMGGRLMKLAKRIAVGLLQDVYVGRNRVAMIAFRERNAELLFGPTDQVELVVNSVAALPCGGTTPLAGGLTLAHETWTHVKHQYPSLLPTMLLISDGRANVGSQPGYVSILAEVEDAARRLSLTENLRIAFLDTTEAGKNDQAARRLTSQLGAERVPLHRLETLSDDPVAAVCELVLMERD